MHARLSDIQQKLAYLLSRHEELKKTLTEAQYVDADIGHLGIQVGEIIGGCRECLDYCARDLVDHFEPERSEKQRRDRIYFPLSRISIEEKAFFRNLRKMKPDAHAALLAIAGKIEDAAELDGVLPHHGYDLLKYISDLVNDKKHDKITHAEALPEAVTLVEHHSGFKSTVSVYDLSEGKSRLLPPPTVLIQPGATQRLVKVFVVDGQEADRLCGNAIKATATVITEVYEKVLGLEDGEVDPWELKKDPEVRLGDRALKRLSPILCRPIVIGLYKQGVRQLGFNYEFDGDVKEATDHLMAGGRFFLEVFRHRFAAIASEKLRGAIKSDWRKIAEQTPDTVSVFELDISLPDTHTLKLGNGASYQFDRIIFGIQFKFRTRQRVHAVSYLPSDITQWNRAIRGMLDDSVPMKISLGQGQDGALRIQCESKA